MGYDYGSEFRDSILNDSIDWMEISNIHEILHTNLTHREFDAPWKVLMCLLKQRAVKVLLSEVNESIKQKANSIISLEPGYGRYHLQRETILWAANWLMAQGESQPQWSSGRRYGRGRSDRVYGPETNTTVFCMSAEPSEVIEELSKGRTVAVYSESYTDYDWMYVFASKHDLSEIIGKLMDVFRGQELELLRKHVDSAFGGHASEHQ